jgi:hypothetical protein
MADLYSVDADRYVGEPFPSSMRPARRAIAVTPSDTLDVTNAGGDNAPCYAKALYVGVTGNLSVVTASDNSNSGAGTAVLFQNVPVGWFPVQVRRVMATGTTASDIVGLYDQ